MALASAGVSNAATSGSGSQAPLAGNFTAATWSSPKAGTVLTLPDNSRVTLPKDWDQMTISNLAAIGLRPDMNGTGQPASIDKYVKGTFATPMNAYGCDGWVCIHVISPSNDGLTVSNWYTSADNPGGYVCTFSAYWDSLTHVFDTGTQVCGQSPGQFRGSLTYPVRHPYNWTACNTWVGIVGKPCESITP